MDEWESLRATGLNRRGALWALWYRLRADVRAIWREVGRTAKR